MKSIVCGAGVVGSSIAEKLSMEGLDVTVIDQSPELGNEQEYFYMIQTNTINDYKRNSTIKSNLGINYSYNPEINTLWASQSEYDKIIISWIHNLEQTQFYELQIWRSESEEINPLDNKQIDSDQAEITNQIDEKENSSLNYKGLYKIK